MASGMLPFRPVVVSVRSGTDDLRPDHQASRKPTATSPNKWWTPLFGFSPEPDYLNSDDKKSIEPEDKDPKPVTKTRFVPGSFTEEKARQLRRMTNDASSFHDPMYHSAIASRLASDFSDR